MAYCSESLHGFDVDTWETEEVDGLIYLFRLNSNFERADQRGPFKDFSSAVAAVILETRLRPIRRVLGEVA